MQHSIRKRLLVGSITVVSVMLAIACLALYSWVAPRIGQQFDQALLARGQALISLTRYRNGQPQLDYERQLAAEAATHVSATLFELWSADGQLIARSPSLQGRPLGDPGSDWAQGSDYYFHDLPDGVPGRLLRVVFAVSPGSVEGKALPANPGVALPQLKLLVALDRQPLEQQLWHLVLYLGAGALLLLLLTGVLLSFAIRKGLQPLTALGQRFDRLQPGNLQQADEIEPQWLELEDISRQYNGLLQRLEQGFARERDTSATIAHELRRPITQLRNLAELAQRHSDDHALMGDFLPRIVDSTQRMEGTVDGLLGMARAEAAGSHPRASVMVLETVVSELWERLARAPQSRSKRLAAALPKDLVVYSDAALLDGILSNLIENALSYSPQSAIIRCRAGADGDKAWLTLANPAPSLRPEHLPQLFKRLWSRQLEGADADSHHAGLGLPLVGLYAEALGLRIEHALAENGEFSITLHGFRRVTNRSADTRTDN
jgi:signal transduction histidine kinase